MAAKSAHDVNEDYEKYQIRQFFHHLQDGICVAEMDVLLGLYFSIYQPQLILLEDKHL